MPSPTTGFDREAVRRRYRHARDRMKFWRRQLRRLAKSPSLALAMRRYRKAVARRDWGALREMLPDVANEAERIGDRQLLAELRLAADQLGAFDLGAELEHAGARLAGTLRPDEWDGGPIAQKQLVVDFVETSKQGAATGLRFTGHVAEAAKDASETVIVAEKRLVPLYARTFPNASVVAGPRAIEPTPGLPQAYANMRVLRAAMGNDPERINGLFTPLQADTAQTATLRRAYLDKGQGRPLVGISWRSTHHGKDLPSLECWAGMMRETNATFVDIQYGERQADLECLRESSGRTVVSDDSVDQLRDMDRFAAQLCALDAVVSISCTGAHLACALGVPIVLVRDDWFRRDWPVLSRATSWCPSAVVLGKDGKPWEDVFAEIPGLLNSMFDGKTTQGSV